MSTGLVAYMGILGCAWPATGLIKIPEGRACPPLGCAGLPPCMFIGGGAYICAVGGYGMS